MKWIIAGIVAYIAFMQFKTNRDRLRLELYKKRFSVYEGLQELLNKIIIRFVVTDEDLREFRVKTNEASFLFDEDIVKYLKEINDKGTKLYSYNCQVNKSNPPPPWPKTPEDIKEIMTWLQDQLEESKDKFSKYLKFKTNIKSFW
ncbi:MAG: hypothetical protein ACYSR0_08035 [Planctomycetota bacterium]|jgi:hypothetical protein